ncbi:HNH endonuclease signature motif containing protein [Gordonia bronchialis]|uniref:HNH endonuclease signature motif containing protein n=1 Tax=Gordonia bronchialis TaxID=2054 RepID=UPI00242FFB83|nr:HNH endonuclease signature motif containing protein [Gordonia bronchialis]
MTDRVVGFAGQIAALTARFVELLAEFDDRKAWSGEGVRSCAHWLSWRTGLSLRTAQDQLRVGHALGELPRIREAFAAGRLTYSKVRAITRVATPAREDELLTMALASTAAQVGRLVRAMRQIDGRSAERGDGADGDGPVVRESTSSWSWNLDGTLSVSLRLSPLDGAAFLAGSVRAEYERLRTSSDAEGDVTRNALAGVDVDDGEPEPARNEPWQRRDVWRHVPANIAPAVVVMADTQRTVSEVPTVAPSAEVVIHKPVDGVVGVSPDPHVEGGPALSDAEMEMAECGSSSREVRHSSKGVRLRWGRKRRAPTAALVRLLSGRDQGCGHPGCERTKHLHVHHVRAWSRGGHTDPDNLILLCPAHHAALHRGEFGIRALGGQRFSFHRTDGSVIEVAPSLQAPAGWVPDRGIAPDTTVPQDGGKLDLAYATDVLYEVWKWKARQGAAVEQDAA